MVLCFQDLPVRLRPSLSGRPITANSFCNIDTTSDLLKIIAQDLTFNPLKVSFGEKNSKKNKSDFWNKEYYVQCETPCLPNPCNVYLT